MTRFDGLMGKLGKLPKAEDGNFDPETLPAPPKQSAPVKKKRGKRNDPDYTQVTAYIKRETHHQVKIALLREGGDREFSELVEELLLEYLRTQQRSDSSS